MPSFQINPLSRVIADLAISVPIGELLTYDMLHEMLGFDVRKKRYLLDRGLQIANQDVGAIFDTVIGSGYKRKPQHEAADLGSYRRAKFRRTARQSRKQIENAIAPMNDIPTAALREISTLGLLEHLAKDRNLVPVKPEATVAPSVTESARDLIRHLGIERRART